MRPDISALHLLVPKNTAFVFSFQHRNNIRVLKTIPKKSLTVFHCKIDPRFLWKKRSAIFLQKPDHDRTSRQSIPGTL
jgi:hypothetical protein